MSIKDSLKKMKDRYAENKESTFESVPAGTYFAKLQNAVFEPSKWPNEETGEYPLQVHREHVIVEGELEGRTVHDWIPWGSYDWAIGATNQWLKILGFEIPDDPTELPDLFLEATDAAPLVKLRVSYKEGRKAPNVRVMSLEGIGKTVESTKAKPEEDVVDDDVVDFCSRHKIKVVGKDFKRAIMKADLSKLKLDKFDLGLLEELGIKVTKSKKKK